MLVEDEQWMITAAAEIAVISRGFLLAVHRAFGASSCKRGLRF